MNRYVYKPGYRGSVPAQIVGDRLDHLRSQQSDPHLTPSIVVNDARPDGAPLHPCFEWDDPVAAERYREEQARGLIRSVYVVQTDDQGKDIPVLANVHVDLPDSGPCYVTTARAVNDGQLRQQVEEEALAAFQALQRRYSHIKGLGAIFKAINATLRAKNRRKQKSPARQMAKV